MLYAVCRTPYAVRLYIHCSRIWLAASGAILVISLCGIFGVMIIPIMQVQHTGQPTYCSALS